jgi:hypothetical protein
MSRETRKPSEAQSESAKSSRRDVLTGVALALGASVLVQANGGVVGSAYAGEGPKKNGPKQKKGARKSRTKKGATPKKEG